MGGLERDLSAQLGTEQWDDGGSLRLLFPFLPSHLLKPLQGLLQMKGSFSFH